MKAMVLAAGLGTRLRPITYEISKPMVPVLDRPVMAHILDLLERHHIDGVIANLHYFPQAIRDYFGERVSYRYEEELLGTAGGVRACREFFAGETVLVISGDALTDIDVGALASRHRDAGGIATLSVKKVADTREYGVVLHDRDGRITGFQEKPEPDEALSDLGNCGIYMFEPEIFDYFPERPFVDWAHDVFPALLEHDVPFFIHEVREYWNDVGSLSELRQGTFDALRGELHLQVVQQLQHVVDRCARPLADERDQLGVAILDRLARRFRWRSTGRSEQTLQPAGGTARCLCRRRGRSLRRRLRGTRDTGWRRRRLCQGELAGDAGQQVAHR